MILLIGISLFDFMIVKLVLRVIFWDMMTETYTWHPSECTTSLTSNKVSNDSAKFQ